MKLKELKNYYRLILVSGMLALCFTGASAQTSSFHDSLERDRFLSGSDSDAGISRTLLTGDPAISQACATAFNALGQYYDQGNGISLKDALSSRTALPEATPEGLQNFLSAQGQGFAGRAQSGLCNALLGGGSALDGGALLQGMGEQGALSLLGFGTSWLQGTGLPFTARLEMEAGFRSGDPYWEVLSVQPLWQDKAEKNFVFAQLSYNRTFDIDGLKGEDKRDTVNAGIAARRLVKDDTMLLGLNVFLDHNFNYNHNRASIGADVQTSLLGASVNRYLPLTKWKSVDELTEERAVSGWDLELRGQLPDLPSWTAYMKGYQWDGLDDVADTYGAEARLEYAPVRGIRVAAGVTKENHRDLDAQLGVRLLYQFGESLDFHLKPVTELVSVKDRAYGKVWRDNTIRVQQRQKVSAQLNVTTSLGANLYSGASGSGALSAGLTLNMPVTVTTQNAGGALAMLRLADGGTLTLGQGTTISIEPGLVKLITGTVQIVSGTTDIEINIPGGMIALLGTDIDVVSHGANSTVRVRDGSIRVTGADSGVVTASAGKGANVAAGTASALDAATATTHGERVSTQIDRVAPPQTGAKFAPYPHEKPQIVEAGDTVGDAIKIGVNYSKAVTVTGTPQLAIKINGNDRVAAYSAGDSTAQTLVFVYALVAGDAGATTLTTHSIDLNGGDITGQGKNAVTTMAAATLALSGAIDPGQDDTPEAFAFSDVTEQAWGTVITSNTVTIDGIGPAAVAVSISGDGNPEISINGGAWGTFGMIAAGETLQLRLTSANAAETLHSATVTVGTASDQWDVTTIGDPCANPAAPVGTTCSDGAIYAGMLDETRLFAAPEDEASTLTWNNGDPSTSAWTFTGANSSSNGLTNSNTLVGLSDAGAPYEAAMACRARGSGWYLPARNELNVIYLAGILSGSQYYWSSSQTGASCCAWAQRPNDGNRISSGNSSSRRVRCVRQ